MSFFRVVAAFLPFLLLSQGRELGTHNWSMSLNQVTASIGPSGANTFTIIVDHDDVSTTSLAATITDYDDCSSVANVGGLTVGTLNTQATTITDTVTIAFDLLGSEVWTPSTTNGTIQFCYLLEATVSNVVINDARVKITANVDLTNDAWSVSGVDIEDTVATNADPLNVAVDYTLTTYQCDDNGDQINTPSSIQPGGSVQACVSYPNGVSGVTVVSFYTAIISQSGGGSSLEIITEGSVNHDFTSVDCSSVSNKCRVKTNIVRDFFNLANEDLTLSGTAVMAVGSRRLQEIPVSVVRGSHRLAQEDPNQYGAFMLDFLVSQATTNGSSTANSRSVLGFLAATSMVAVVLATS